MVRGTLTIVPLVTQHDHVAGGFGLLRGVPQGEIVFHDVARDAVILAADIVEEIAWA